MDECGVDIGAVVVLDPKTGAIRACASRPVFDSNDPAKSLSDSNSPFINRAFCAFATIPPSGVLWTAGGYNYKSFKKIT